MRTFALVVISFLVGMLATLSAMSLLSGCTVNAPISVSLPDPFNHDLARASAPADMAKPADLAPLTCGNAGTVCDPGQVCWHNNCLDPCQVPDSADMAGCP